MGVQYMVREAATPLPPQTKISRWNPDMLKLILNRMFHD